MSQQLPLSFIAGLTLTLGVASAPGIAQEPASAWPSKPVTLVIGLVPGGGADAEGRLYGEKLMAAFGKPWIIESKPGAGGTIAAAYVAKANPDGYTFLAVTTSFSVAPAFNDKLPYDVLKDFAPVSMMSGSPVVLVAAPGFPPNNLAEYIAYAKANPNKILWGTAGSGAMNHLSGIWLHSEINAPATFVHYKGNTQLLPDLLSSRIHVHPSALQNSLPHIRSGKIKAIAMMTRTRAAELPDVRTVQEQGIPDFEQPNYFGIVTTARTDPAIINKVSAELQRIARAPDVVKKMESEGSVMVGNTPAEFGKYLAGQVNRWTKMVKEKGITQE